MAGGEFESRINQYLSFMMCQAVWWTCFLLFQLIFKYFYEVGRYRFYRWWENRLRKGKELAWVNSVSGTVEPGTALPSEPELIITVSLLPKVKCWSPYHVSKYLSNSMNVIFNITEVEARWRFWFVSIGL